MKGFIGDIVGAVCLFAIFYGCMVIAGILQ
jgi:hypothetical protein